MTQDVLDIGALGALSERIAEGRRAANSVASWLREEGLREDAWRILFALRHSDGLVMGELAHRLALPPATTTRLVDDLVANALVFRKPSEEDGRLVVVHISRVGDERLSMANAIIAARLQTERRLSASR